MDNPKQGKKKKIIEKPYYLGGPKAMRAFISKNIKYPKEALENKIEGSVYCRYKINHQGEVVDVSVISGLGYGCDEEAVRIIRSLQFDLPKIPHRVKAYFQKTIRIHFNLKIVAKEKEPSQKQNIDYQYKLVNDPKKKAAQTYNFMININ